MTEIPHIASSGEMADTAGGGEPCEGTVVSAERLPGLQTLLIELEKLLGELLAELHPGPARGLHVVSRASEVPTAEIFVDRLASSLSEIGAGPCECDSRASSNGTISLLHASLADGAEEVRPRLGDLG